ncbi:WAT1-related protein At1g21890-like [Apium graveolens]|uniref:WAT1-related protein At1g21890-like n=1 Tax=Apium graveolens TaxID=4045 RepID=UPI003D7A40B2
MAVVAQTIEMLMKVKPYFAMVFLQFGFAGMFIIVMIAMQQGMSHWVLVVYRHLLATLAIAPFAFVLERKIRPKLTLSVFLKVMLLGLLEPVIDQNLYYVGMKFTSATFASATNNVIPALTFIMAILFRMERVNLRQKHGLAKVIGTSLTVSGAMLMTLYKGPIVDIFGYSPESVHRHSSAASSDQHWAAGTLMLLLCCVGWSAFFIVQSITLKEYPAELSLTSLICFTGMVEGGIVALVMERDLSAWAIAFDFKLLAAVYSGVVGSGIAYYVQGYVNKVKGPVFVTAFTPLSMIVTAILGVVLLSEQVHLGSLLGACVIVMGLYSVVWGKSKDDPVLTSGESSKLNTELPVVCEKSITKSAHDFLNGPSVHPEIDVLKISHSGEP